MDDNLRQEERLESLLTEPSAGLVEDMARLPGDIMVLGAGGKMGPTLCRLMQNAAAKAGVSKKITAVSRFSDEKAAKALAEGGVSVIPCDLLDQTALNALPEAENILYMAGRKFGTGGSAPLTWAVNAMAPSYAARRFQGANIVVFSSGNLYPMVPLNGKIAGATEETPLAPRGEYAMSCLARERIFEHAAQTFGTRVLLFRLNYAVDMRYGVLYDIAKKVLAGEPVSLSVPVFNCIWQGSANEAAVRSLLHTAVPAAVLNVTGPETLSVRYAAERLGQYLEKAPVFCGEEGEEAMLNHAGKAIDLFGYPRFSADTLIKMQAEWLLQGGGGLGKPTHFEVRNGEY